jgi:RNA polymerase sigma factor (TIGR02999 family)
VTPEELLPQVYDELRKLAAAKLLAEQPGHTLDATALVHEVWLKLGAERSFASKSDYRMAAAQAMRRVLVDSVRARMALKRGAGKRQPLDSDHPEPAEMDDRIDDLHEALERLATIQPRQAELVTLHRFGGLTLTECAETLGISERTADLWWSYARAWLVIELKSSNH